MNPDFFLLPSPSASTSNSPPTEEEEPVPSTQNPRNPNPKPAQYTTPIDWNNPCSWLTFYQTALVRLNGGEPVRILLSSGYPVSLITRELAGRLHLFQYGKLGHFKVVLSSMDRRTTRDFCCTAVRGIHSAAPVLGSVERENLADLGYPLADTSNAAEHPIQIILGLEYFGRLWKPVHATPFGEGLWLRESIFGWIVFGVVHNPSYGIEEVVEEEEEEETEESGLKREEDERFDVRDD